MGRRSFSKRGRRLSSKFKPRRGRVSRRRSTGRGLFRSAGRHKRLSRQVIKSFFPDVANSKMLGHHIWTGIPCNDLSTSLVFQQGATTSNTITIKMNANPNGGNFYFQPGTDVASTDQLLPNTSYRNRYTRYRPMGCKVVVTVFSQDAGNNPAGTGNTQVATPFMLYGFPFCRQNGTADNYANEWTGASLGYTSDTVPQMKYGFRKISYGLGGKNCIKYSTYWDFAKILGLTRHQYLADDLMYCQPDDNSTDPIIDVNLCLAIADYTPAVARQCSVDIKITQYGRWEGQQITFQ